MNFLRVLRLRRARTLRQRETLAARCQSLRFTCEFCGHDVHLPCDDAEAAERCRTRPSRGEMSG